MAKAELVRHGAHTAQAPAEDGAIVLSMLNKLMEMPDVPVEKMEKLLDLHMRMEGEKAKRAYVAEFSKMQLPTIEKLGKSHNSKYAKWEDIVESIIPILKKHGFALSFRTKVHDGKITITGVLGHKDGHSENTELTLPSDTSGSKNAIQAIGSTTSYGKRYTACALLNIVARDEDDDGNSIGGVITQEQCDVLQELVHETGTDVKQFFKVAEASCYTKIPSKKFQTLHALLLKKRNAS